MRIGDREIGGDSVYVIAELGVNHDGDPARALELVDAAAAAGADAVKFQLFETDRLMSRSAKLAAYQRAAGETDPVAMLRRLELPLAAMARCVERAHALGVHAIVTCFSTELVAAAQTLPWDAYKTASPDIVHRPLLEALARTGRPLIISTGAAEPDEVARAAGWLDGWGAGGRTTLMQCVSSYPTPPERAELGGIAALRGVFDGPVGYSDHTPEVDTARDAVLAGADLLEKHLTYDRGAKGPDHAASLTPDMLAGYVSMAEMGLMTRKVRGVRAVPGGKRVLDIERDVRAVSRQSLVAVRDLGPGETLRREHVTIKRPGTGVCPFEMDSAIGRRLTRGVAADTVIGWDDLDVR